MPFRRLPTAEAEAFEPMRYLPNQPWPLVVAILDKELERAGRTTAVLVSGFEYTHTKKKLKVRAPVGYVTDFASIPGFLRAMVSPFGRHAKAAVLHDWLYAVGEPGRRRLADELFLEAMKELGVPWTRRQSMYWAVRFFGAKPYRLADAEWQASWARWQTGDACPPPGPRESWYAQKTDG